VDRIGDKSVELRTGQAQSIGNNTGGGTRNGRANPWHLI
jgi:hypothetical protein